MKPSTIKYFIDEGFTNVGKNLLMTMASVAAVAACISLLSFSYCVVMNVNHVLTQLQDSIGISVFVGGQPNSTMIANMRKDIEGIDHVVHVDYISPNDALRDFKETWGAEEDIFEGLDSANNPLSHAFHISIDDIKNQALVLADLEKVENVDNIRHGQTETEVLTNMNHVFSIASIIVMVLLAGISIMIIINTIRISVANRKVEINIMKYVGATDWFIRWPFILEGVIIGFIGSVIPILIGIPIYTKSVELIYAYIPMIDMFSFYFTGDIYIILTPLALFFGGALGVCGSVTSIRKHLKV